MNSSVYAHGHGSLSGIEILFQRTHIFHIFFCGEYAIQESADIRRCFFYFIFFPATKINCTAKNDLHSRIMCLERRYFQLVAGLIKIIECVFSAQLNPVIAILASQFKYFFLAGLCLHNNLHAVILSKYLFLILQLRSPNPYRYLLSFYTHIEHFQFLL